MERIYGFNKDDATTLKFLARDKQNSSGSTGANLGGSRIPGNNIRMCKTVTAIPARTGDIAGSVDDVEWFTINEAGEMSVTSGTSMKVYNPFSSEVAAGAYILVTQVYGVWIVTAEDCSA